MRRTQRVRLSAARETYLDWIKPTLAKDTVLHAQMVLRGVERASGDIYVDSLRQEDVQTYLAAMRAPHLDARGIMRGPISARTYNHYVCIIRQFVQWMIGRGWIRLDIYQGFRRIRETQITRQRLSTEQVARMLQNAVEPRDCALIAVGYFTATRSAEIRSMTVGDVDLTGRTIFIHVWKSKLEDEFPIGPELYDELYRWFAEYNKEVGRLYGRQLIPTDALIPARMPRRFLPGHEVVDGKRVRRWAAGGLDPSRPIHQPHLPIREGMRLLGLSDFDEGVHTLRRSAARHVFDALIEERRYDGALRIVRSMLHHACTETTERYIGLSTERLHRDEFLRTATLLDFEGQRRVGLRVVPKDERPGVQQPSRPW